MHNDAFFEDWVRLVLHLGTIALMCCAYLFDIVSISLHGDCANISAGLKKIPRFTRRFLGMKNELHNNEVVTNHD